MRFTFRSTLARSSQYRPDIDGLRAVAVLSVLFFHAKVRGFPGGFVGVDVFFVISGYLITSIIAKDIFSGRFSFISFYERRMRRIFPALFFLIFVCTFIAAIVFAPEDFESFAKATIATTCFVSNFYFLRHAVTGGYFANLSDLQALLHTWSLAVEEQFYFLFPALLFLLVRWTRQRAAQLLFVCAILSFALSIWLTHRNPSAAFYMLSSRAWELLMGSLLALKAVPPIRMRLVREVSAAAGLALILFAVFLFTNETPFPGPSAFIPCFGAFLLIYSGEQGSSWANAILTFPPLVFIGVISYSLYLWHWPLIVFGRYFLLSNLGRAATIGVIAGSVLMAFISFEFVESPFRGRDSVFSRRQVFSLGLAASLASLALALIIYRTGGIPQRYDASTRQLVLENSARLHDYPENCSNWKTNPQSLADIHFCVLGPNADKKILFWGDSHVEQLYPAVKHLYDNGELQGHGAVFAIGNSCPPTEHLNVSEKNYHCDTFATLVMKRAEMDDVDTVFIGFSTWWAYSGNTICPSVNGRCVNVVSPDEIRRLFLSELSSEIHRLSMDGKRVIICLPFPLYDKSIPNLEIRNAVFSRFGFSGIARDLTSPAFRDQIFEASKTAGADIFDPRKSLCSNDPCITQINGVSIYLDNNHLAASQVGILEDNLRQVLDSQAAPLAPRDQLFQSH
jgi:peptidoglycan/LPS O-acetylase OafA/YrhL